jgi:hypothetical protein
VLCILFSSCVIEPNTTGGAAPIERQKENFYYLPSTPNTPLSVNRGDLSLHGHLAASAKNSGSEVQATYVAGDHIGLIAGYSALKNKGGETTYLDFKKFEVGFGYMRPLSTGWHFETYGGIGTGKLVNFHYSGISNMIQTSYFLQPGLAYNSRNNRFTAGMVSKFSAVKFRIKDMFFDPQTDPYSFDQLKNLQDNSLHLFWEPALLLRAGWKNFRFETSYTFSTDFNGAAINRAKENFSIGAALTVNTRKHNKP